MSWSLARPRLSRALVAALAAVVVMLSAPAGAAPLFASQTLRLVRPGDGQEALFSYTALSYTDRKWRLRGSLSWYSWSGYPDVAGTATSGPGALYLTGGRSLWRRSSPSHTGQVWLQLKATVPLQTEVTVASSGQSDLGASILATNRFQRFLVFLEVGYLDRGDPAGIVYQSGWSVAVSASWRPRRVPVYPIAGWVAATRVVDGGEGYGEWSAGFGMNLGRRVSVSALLSGETNGDGPGRGGTVILGLRI